jgi:hypothetical protein
MHDDHPLDPERETRAEERIRVTLLARLLEQGVLAPDPTTGEVRPQRVLLGGGDAAPHVVLAGRVLVPADRLEESRAALGDLVAGVRNGRDGVLGRLEVAEILLHDDDAVWDALNRLAGIDPPVDARPHHVFFNAVIWSRIKEGDDPEPAPRPAGPDRARVAHGEGAKVAVVDNGIAKESLGDPYLATGLEYDADDIDPKRVYEVARGTPPGTLDVGAGHGTFVAGVIRQLAPASTVKIIRALDSDGVAPEERVAAGVLEAREWGADIVNLSFGGYTESDQPPILLGRAIASLHPEVIVVAAAGNEGTDRPIFPGAIRRVVSVAATDQLGNDRLPPITDLAPFSNYGWWVDAAAPGTWHSTFVTGLENPALDPEPDTFKEPFAESGGTSFAAAAVTGALAALLDEKDCPEPRDALRHLLGRPANRRLPWGGMSVDVWG